MFGKISARIRFQSWKGRNQNMIMKRFESESDHEKVWIRIRSWNGLNQNPIMKRSESESDHEMVWIIIRSWKGLNKNPIMKRSGLHSRQPNKKLDDKKGFECYSTCFVRFSLKFNWNYKFSEEKLYHSNVFILVWLKNSICKLFCYGRQF